MQSSSQLDYFEVFPWNKNFETGHAEIDEQHQVLVTLLNKLANTLANDTPVEVNQAFEELAKYADYHFEAEELIWSQYFKDDPWYISHQLSHSSFLPKVLELKEKDANKPLQDVVEDIVQFLIRWLAFHIIDDDKRLALVVEAMSEGKTMEEAKLYSDKKMNGSIRILIETVLTMYDGLSSRTLKLMRERNARIKAEEQLKEVNRQLEMLSITDQLTGLFNRRHFENTFSSELKRAKRAGQMLQFYLFDIDYFKKLNDRYGHAAGDEALQQVGQRLLEVCRRPSDFAFRIGGEEFAVITVGESKDSCLPFGDIIRSQIEDLQIENLDSDINDNMTVSVGALTIDPEEHNDISECMTIVDRRLYLAKKQGRNRVVCCCDE